MDLQQAEALYKKAIYAYTLGSFDEAIKLWSKIKNTHNLGNIYEDAQLQIGMCFKQKGCIDKAIEYWKKINDKSFKQQAYINLGSAFSQKGLSDEAIEYWKKVDKTNKDYRKIALNIAVIFIEKNQSDDAMEYLLDIDNQGDFIYDQAQYHLARIKYEKGSLEAAIFFYKKISNINQDLFSIALFNLGAIYKELSDVENSIKYWKEIKEFHKKTYSTAQYNLGLFYSDKGEYKEAIIYWSRILSDTKDDYASAQFSLGLTYMKLNKLEKAREHWRNISSSYLDNYVKAQYYLGDVFLYSENINDKLENRINSWNKIPCDHILYNYIYYRFSISKEIKSCERIVCKEAFFYISDKIDNLLNILHVNSDFENYIAHYTNITVSKLLLSSHQEVVNYKEKSPLRLNTINLMNDPEEGLLINKLLCLDSEIKTQDLAFISCFTLHHDSLNQFRLYAKENHQEATGLSLVINKNFFEKYYNVGKMLSRYNILQNSIENEKPEKNLEIQKVSEKILGKSPLYRCIYLDPTSGLIKVAQREEWSFHREYRNETKQHILEPNLGAEETWNQYQKEIVKIESEVSQNLKELVEQVKSLNQEELSIEEQELLAEILLPLRYLIKHMAFKEEQECRMIYITQMDNPLIQYDEKINRIYIDYEPSVMEHLEKIYLAPKAKGEKMVFEYLCTRGQVVRKGKDAVKVKISQNPFR